MAGVSCCACQMSSNRHGYEHVPQYLLFREKNSSHKNPDPAGVLPWSYRFLQHRWEKMKTDQWGALPNIRLGRTLAQKNHQQGYNSKMKIEQTKQPRASKTGFVTCLYSL